MNRYLTIIAFLILMTLPLHAKKAQAPINREALVKRHIVNNTAFDSFTSLSVGNGQLAFTVDATGLQTYPELYSNGVPLGTQSQWGWHSFPNINNYKPEETYKVYDYHGRQELYAVQFNEKGRNQEAADYFRENPHRLHLGIIGLDIRNNDGSPVRASEITNINQSLQLWDGFIQSTFNAAGGQVSVKTICLPDEDRISSKVTSGLFADKKLSIKIKFPYPSGKHSDDACDWNSPEKHSTSIIEQTGNYAVLERTIDNDHYWMTVTWEGNATFKEVAAHDYRLIPGQDDFSFSCRFHRVKPLIVNRNVYNTDFSKTVKWWNDFWKSGGAVDFLDCKDPRAFELERRVVLSQYLMTIQCAGEYPPQETGLTYNSWYGKYHLEMHWWHGVHFALWGRPELLERSLGWYEKAKPAARQIAKRQNRKGVRWMKMTDPSATEAPSKVGSFLIWQQPHFIYMAELMYRNNPDTSVLNKYKDLVFATAEFMADYVDYDGLEDRYVLKGAIPAQETLKASETVNPPFELSYWHYALSVAQKWRTRLGMQKNMEWEIIIDKLSPLAHENGLYLAAETAHDTYIDPRYTSDHMAVLGALGILPKTRLVRNDIMTNTFNWIWDNWNWGKTWGWDYPMTAMCAARLGMPDKAVGALLMDKRTNTYLVNGHNYQDGRLRIYLPGNGGLLTTVAMMCAGWDGSTGKNPGFPKDGKWNVKWEGLKPMP
jgi:hypothetical protein